METRTKFWYDNDGSVGLIKMNDEVFLDNLVPKVYSVHLDEMRGFYLKTEFNQFKLPEKLYGGMQSQTDRVLKTYASRSTSTGVLLTGDKGAGKTLLAQSISNAMITRNNVPVILVGQPFTGVAFQSFVDQIGEAVFLFDEFGKMYSGSIESKETSTKSGNGSQDGLLTILDGAARAKRMFILTENDVYKINNYLLDRPSRIYYHFKYSKMEEAAIVEYCSDRNLSADTSDAIVDISRRMAQFNFDMLQAIVEECLRYDAAPSEVEKLLADLNINFNIDEDLKLRVIQVIEDNNGQPIVLTKGTRDELFDFPSSQYDYIGVTEQLNCSDGDDDEDCTVYHAFHKLDIVYRTVDRVIFRNEGYTCVAEVVKRSAYASGYYKQMAQSYE